MPIQTFADQFSLLPIKTFAYQKGPVKRRHLLIESFADWPLINDGESPFIKTMGEMMEVL